MSMTKNELRPEEGEPEEERADQHDPRDYDAHSIREAQRQAWNEGVRNFAIWKDGKQYTAMGRELSEALKLNPYGS